MGGVFPDTGIGGEIMDRVSSILEPLRAFAPLEVILAVAVGATVMAIWWLIRKLLKWAFYTGIVGVVAWLSYFGVPD